MTTVARRDEANPTAWTVTCLCAAWCGVCRDYQPTFERLALEYPGVVFRWSDVEEDEDTADADVETFPTLRIVQGGALRFFGPVLPQAHHLTTLLRGLMAASA